MRLHSLAGWATVALLACSLLAARAHAGAWTLDAGRLWLKQGVGYWQTDRKFASSLDTGLTFTDRDAVRQGERIPFDPTTGGTLQALSITTEARLGLLRWLQIGVSLPLLWNDFDTDGVDSVDSRFGLGDIRISTQTSLPLDTQPFVFAARVELKLPTGKFDPSIYAAPLTEGQLDVEAIASAGVSLYPYGYANVELGWRARFENSANQREPGDELLFEVEGGLQLPYDLVVKLVFDGLVGFEGSGKAGAAEITLPRRRLYSLWAGLLWMPASGLTFEVDGRFMLAGEDYPAGIQLFFSGSYELRLWGGATVAGK